MTQYIKPADLDEAYAARAEHPNFALLSGGTDFMVGVLHRELPPGVIDLFDLEGMRGVELQDDAFRIGAATTYADLIRDQGVTRELPLLCDCARTIGAVQIQERGTLGGNVATSSPVGDTLPALLALDAVLLLGSVGGLRRVNYHEFCTGYRKTALHPDEVVVAIEIPRPAPVRQYWRKVGTRKAQAISKVMVAASARTDGTGAMHDVRLAMGAVADRPLRLTACESLLEGKQPSHALAIQLKDKVSDAITPIDDVRSTAPYRLRAARNLAARFVLDLCRSTDA